jgi:uncharacterized damage-inducible protein DinB
MNGPEAIQSALQRAQRVLEMLMADLSDADLLVRPVPGAHHIAWQLGHLIASEGHLLKQAVPAAAVAELPAGFAEKHDKATAFEDPPKGYGTKAQYLELFDKVRGVTLKTVAQMPDADLDKPMTGRMAQFAPTAGAVLMLISNHTLMHAGQFIVMRRKLGKPILI